MAHSWSELPISALVPYLTWDCPLHDNNHLALIGRVIAQYVDMALYVKLLVDKIKTNGPVPYTLTVSIDKNDDKMYALFGLGMADTRLVVIPRGVFHAMHKKKSKKKSIKVRGGIPEVRRHIALKLSKPNSSTVIGTAGINQCMLLAAGNRLNVHWLSSGQTKTARTVMGAPVVDMWRGGANGQCVYTLRCPTEEMRRDTDISLCLLSRISLKSPRSRPRVESLKMKSVLCFAYHQIAANCSLYFERDVDESKSKSKAKKAKKKSKSEEFSEDDSEEFDAFTGDDFLFFASETIDELKPAKKKKRKKAVRAQTEASATELEIGTVTIEDCSGLKKWAGVKTSGSSTVSICGSGRRGRGRKRLKADDRKVAASHSPRRGGRLRGSCSTLLRAKSRSYTPKTAAKPKLVNNLGLYVAIPPQHLLHSKKKKKKDKKKKTGKRVSFIELDDAEITGSVEPMASASSSAAAQSQSQTEEFEEGKDEFEEKKETDDGFPTELLSIDIGDGFDQHTASDQSIHLSDGETVEEVVARMSRQQSLDPYNDFRESDEDVYVIKSPLVRSPTSAETFALVVTPPASASAPVSVFTEATAETDSTRITSCSSSGSGSSGIFFHDFVPEEESERKHEKTMSEISELSTASGSSEFGGGLSAKSVGYFSLGAIDDEREEDPDGCLYYIDDPDTDVYPQHSADLSLSSPILSSAATFEDSLAELKRHLSAKSDGAILVHASQTSVASDVSSLLAVVDDELDDDMSVQSVPVGVSRRGSTRSSHAPMTGIKKLKPKEKPKARKSRSLMPSATSKSLASASKMRRSKRKSRKRAKSDTLKVPRSIAIGTGAVSHPSDVCRPPKRGRGRKKRTVVTKSRSIGIGGRKRAASSHVPLSKRSGESKKKKKKKKKRVCFEASAEEHSRSSSCGRRPRLLSPSTSGTTPSGSRRRSYQQLRTASKLAATMRAPCYTVQRIEIPSQLEYIFRDAKCHHVFWHGTSESIVLLIKKSNASMVGDPKMLGFVKALDDSYDASAVRSQWRVYGRLLVKLKLVLKADKSPTLASVSIGSVRITESRTRVLAYDSKKSAVWFDTMQTYGPSRERIGGYGRRYGYGYGVRFKYTPMTVKLRVMRLNDLVYKWRHVYETVL